MYQRPGNAEVSGRYKNTTTISKLLNQLDHAYLHSPACFPGKIARGDKNGKVVVERKKRGHESSKGCPSKGQGLVQHQWGQNPLTVWVARLLLPTLRLDV